MSVKMSPVTSRIVIVLVKLHGPAITSVPERSETALQCQSKTFVYRREMGRESCQLREEKEQKILRDCVHVRE